MPELGPVALPPRRTVLWSMLAGPVRARAVRLVADEHGLDGAAAAAAVVHALLHDESPYGADVERAMSRALGDSYREALAPAVEAVRAWAAAYGEQVRRMVEQLGPVFEQMQDVQRGRTPPVWVRPLDGRRRR